MQFIIQLILAAKGYYTGDMDAEFGSGTEKAVKGFQKTNGLVQDGEVGAETWYKLFNCLLVICFGYMHGHNMIIVVQKQLLLMQKMESLIISVVMEV